MTTPHQLAKTLVVDTSVLVNFLAVDRLDVLRCLVEQLLATDHVADEITEDFPEQRARYERALQCGDLIVASVNTPDALTAFAQLIQDRVLGMGECSAIAFSGTAGHGLAIDDKRARSSAAKTFPNMLVVGTKDVVVAAIRAGHLTVAEADAIKGDWETNHRFKFRFGSFSEVI